MTVVEHPAVADPLEETREEIRRLPETPEPKTREQILHEAADLIEKRGWAEGRLELDGSYCMAGAVAQAALGVTDHPVFIDGRWHSPSRVAAQIIGANSYEHVYRTNDRLRYTRPPEHHWYRRSKLTNAERAVRILRRVADGMTFAEAAEIA